MVIIHRGSIFGIYFRWYCSTQTYRYCAELRGVTLLWCQSVMILHKKHIATLSALYFAVTVYCRIFCIVVQFRLFLTNDPQKAKVTQEQDGSVSCTSTSISAIHSVSHVEVGSYMVSLNSISLFVVCWHTVMAKTIGLVNNVIKCYVAGFNWHVIFKKIIFFVFMWLMDRLCEVFQHIHKA